MCFFGESPAERETLIRILAPGIVPGTNAINIAFRLTCLIGIGLIFFVFGAGITRFVGWIVRGFVSKE